MFRETTAHRATIASMRANGDREKRRAAMLFIVTDDGRLLLHHRDDKAGIPHPDCWAGFGGAVEDGETPLEALHREILEETGVEVQHPRALGEALDVEGDGRLVSLYYVEGGIGPDDIDLREGAGIGVHFFDDLDHLKVTPFVRRAIERDLRPLIEDVVVRRAHDHEGGRVAELWLVSRKASAPLIPLPVHSDAEVIDWFTTVVLPSQEVWVAEVAGELVAVMVLDHEWIEQLYVHPSWTGRGLGSRLVNVARKGRRGLQLWTFEANARARRFYEREGFVAVGRTDGDNEEGAPDIRYEWSVDGRR
jgi:8-oxo-dGTP pyrophosphatase MutT (NUDIX family)